MAWERGDSDWSERLKQTVRRPQIFAATIEQMAEAIKRLRRN